MCPEQEKNQESSLVGKMVIGNRKKTEVLNSCFAPVFFSQKEKKKQSKLSEAVLYEAEKKCKSK